MHEEKYLLQIIRFLLNSESGSGKLEVPYTLLDWNRLISIAKQHEVANVLYYVIDELSEKFQPDKELRGYMKQFAMRAVALNIKQQAAKEEILNAFEKNNLYCMPIKGICTKEFYPKSEWRTMGDLDILYRPEQYESVKKVLLQLGYGDFEKGQKHDHYTKPPFIMIEMHRALVSRDSLAKQYYEDVWKKAEAVKGFRFVYQMSLEEQYILTMLHLLEHFKEGGIGIRFIMDIYVFNKVSELKREEIESVFAELGILQFAKNIEALASKWFAEKDTDESEGQEPLLDELEQFVIHNGVYGQTSNTRALEVAKAGRADYIRRELFPNYEIMKTQFLWLRGKRYLVPIAWIVRIVKALLFKKKSVQLRVNTVKYGDMQKGKELREFHKRCGI